MKSTHEAFCLMSLVMTLPGRLILPVGFGNSHNHALAWIMAGCPDMGTRARPNIVITHGRLCEELRVHLQPGSSPRPVVLMSLGSKELFSSAKAGTARRTLAVQSFAPVMSFQHSLFAECLFCLSTPVLAPGLLVEMGRLYPDQILTYCHCHVRLLLSHSSCCPLNSIGLPHLLLSPVSP